MRIKKLQLIIVLGIILTFSSCSTKTTDKEIDSNLNKLLEQKNYFKLAELLAKTEDKLAEDRALYYKAFIAQAFGKQKESNQYIETIFEKYRKQFNDTLIVTLLDLQAANFLYSHNYKKSSEIYKTILSRYPKIVDSADIVNYTNVANLFGTFSNTKPQIMHKHGLVHIASHRNKFNHLMVPTKSNGVTADFIFDTGANLSTICESLAKKMGFTIFEQNIAIGSSTKTNVKSKLAVADSLYVGDILFENVTFIVMPDEQLTFAEIDYQIKGIIGFPIIHQLEEVRLNKNGSITVPSEAGKSSLKNMVMDGLNPVVKLTSKKDTLLFTLDTGAKSSDLSLKYYKENKKQVDKDGKLETNKRGGAGGITEVKEYILSNFPMTIGTKSTTLSKIPVSLEEYEFNKFFDGNLGQDVFKQFNTLILNFKYMYIDLE